MPLPQQPTLAARLAQARAASDALFDVVKPEFLYERPIRERHRIVFYIGHLEAFDRNLFDKRLFDLPSPDQRLDQLFAFGIDPVDGGLPTDMPADWPALAEVHGYGREVRDHIDERLAALDLPPETPNHDTVGQLLNVAIEHRLMHVETLAYMLHQLPFAQKRAPDAPRLHADHLYAVEPGMVPVPAGRTELGMTAERGVFGWDNEFGEQQVDVPAFEIDRYMVTNGAFLEFVEDGGYRRRDLWNDADWAWKDSTQVAHPVFWSRDAVGWRLRTMFDDIPLPLAWPVYVSHAEASAFARWRGAKLPSEAQWQRAAHGALPGPTDNFDFRDWNPVAVDATPDSASTWGVEGLYGNGWEWTSTLFAPLPGFKAFPFYEGYSANFFDGQHYAMKGGSPRTAQCMLRPTFRNWFQPRYQYVYAGFRCVRD
ncbi:SUMF1/EgtB/PvdO family nonheme iron enzyme [Paraburkholderia unamae]|uniref:Ergothioneine biosynthesis protein EgtB n=1 Tax=Paraburkholderia unamae TaxID=219649 RepID=A0ABX5KB20_9BURK|nr:SUMF1/EgtB/PvdO family nonheme iron enzyme [Paraburkholderia unamae]PVX72502.1 ergothioneine biosynthesis protein EgtB [Paraburkholderia unamae]CAG9250959.1 Ergothioneine biosynthesis protein EgtB [Paraburkholderia unamae]